MLRINKTIIKIFSYTQIILKINTRKNGSIIKMSLCTDWHIET